MYEVLISAGVLAGGVAVFFWARPFARITEFMAPYVFSLAPERINYIFARILGVIFMTAGLILLASAIVKLAL